MKIKNLIILSSILGISILPSTIIWMEIGPLGKEFYGQNVPDIYIHGGYIKGKDLNFWGINFAYKFQLSLISYFIVSNLISIKWIIKKTLVSRLMKVNLVLLILFPLWIYTYVDGVISNCDGAAGDLKIHFGGGIAIFLLLLVNGILILKKFQQPITKHSCGL